jgi:hypothetical protein
MDIFGTAVTASNIIYQFLTACAAFSKDAESLAARFKWDLVALEAINDYFRKLHSPTSGGGTGLSKKHEQLLKTTADYLNGFTEEIQKSQKKLKREGMLADAINHVMWQARQRDLEKMQAELQYWTDRFGVRVIALPEEVRNVINMASVDESPNAAAPAVVRSNQALLEFQRLTSDSDVKQRRAKEMLKEDAAIARKINGWNEISFIPLPDGDKQVIFATRGLPPAATLGTTGFNTIKNDVCVLAAALNCLDPAAGVRLLKVDYCLYHADSNQFLLAQVPPYHTTSMMSLGEMIAKTAFPQAKAALGDRLGLAHKLAEAVVFLHAARFLHKNISSSSAVALHRAPPRRAKASSRTASGSGSGTAALPAHGTPRPSPLPSPLPLAPVLDEVYLMGFDLIRGVDSRTLKEGAVFVQPGTGAHVGDGDKGDNDGQAQAQAPPRPIWDRAIYMHPDRLRDDKDKVPKFEKAHDVYSLGVVLLEIGLWERLGSAAAGSTKASELKEGGDPKTWPAELTKLAAAPGGLAARVGKRYYDIVEWCLSLDGDDGVEQTEFVQKVLDPLEEMARAVS